MENKKLNIYLANLAILNAKMHNLHWNIQGSNFPQVHVALEKLYDDLLEKYDEVAEYQKMTGVYPLASYREYLEVTSVKELESKDYSIEEAIKIAIAELKSLKALALEIRKEASEDAFILVNKMEDHVEGYTKAIWVLEASAK